MIDITYLDKENLKFLGSGLFGTVYKINDDVAYKIYHKTIKQDYGLDKTFLINNLVFL